MTGTVKLGPIMSEKVNSIYDWQEIEIYTRQILGKKAFRDVCTLWQEKSGGSGAAAKQPVRLFIVNDGACPGVSPPAGSPVKSVKLCKRAVLPDYPKNLITGTKRSRIIHRYSLVLLLEYENGEFKVITLPRQMSAPGSYSEGITMAFCGIISPNGGIPVPQRTEDESSSEKLSVIPDGSVFSAFEYTMAFPVNAFEPPLSLSDIENTALKSAIQLAGPRFESDIAEPFLIPAGADGSIWTTAVDLALYEDITIKLGVDQEIVVQGVSEL